MLNPKKEYVRFKNLDEKLEKLKELKIISPTSKEVKDLFYMGLYVNEPTKCDVIGFVDDLEIIIDIKGKLHSIHPAYFKEMQNKNFSIFNSDVEG